MIVLPFRARAGQADESWLAGRLATLQVGRWVNEAYRVYPTARPAMPRMTRLPEEVARLLTPLKPYFRHRHYMVLCWLVMAHLVFFEKATLQALARQV